MSRLFVTLWSRMVVAPATPNPDRPTIITIIIGNIFFIFLPLFLSTEYILCFLYKKSIAKSLSILLKYFNNTLDYHISFF